MTWALLPLPLLLITLSLACSPVRGGPPPADPAPGTWLSYHGEVRPIVESACTPCHAPGEIAEDLDLRYDPASWSSPTPPWAAVTAAAVASGDMPPWLPDDACRPILGSLALSPSDRQVIADWAAADFPPGDPSDFRQRSPRTDPMAERAATFGDPDRILSPDTPYTPSTVRSDDYRCFLLDDAFDADTWINGIEVVPDRAEQVHHVILYMYLAEEQARIQDILAADAADPGPGFSCYGSPRAQTMTAWAPGISGEFLRPGLARKAPAGAMWFLQIHYNTLGQQQPAADQTRVHVWTQDEAPQDVLLNVEFANLDIMLPAADPDIEHTLVIDLGPRLGLGRSDLRVPITGIMAHMHQFGEQIEASILHGDGDESCLINIPRWRFEWQQQYFFEEGQAVWIDRDSRASMTCRYDNSLDNQVVVDGVQREPRDVYWRTGHI